MRKYLVVILVSLSLTLFASPKREMRAAWIATVANIDWPMKSAVGNTEQQKHDMIVILDSLQACHFNAVIFQIRPTADALYHSDYEPWSSWLTGKQGKAPHPYYDPLQFVVEEAHKRCIDVHVWLNPYRVTHTFGVADMDHNHIYRQHPEWFVKYGDKYYFNPGLDATRKWLNQVVADIVSRYDIDAIHFDDYFYPYKVKGEEFPDDKAFKDFPRGFTNKADWRRNNVNLIIQELQHTIKSIKPWVEFGISPFGVWRNAKTDPVRGSKTQAGVQNYDDLYADILLWLEKGWIDYVMPQLYWEIGKKNADFTTLLDWWAKYSYKKNFYVGVFASQLGNSKGSAAWMRPNEICRQIRLVRTKLDVDGISCYSVVALMDNRVGLRDSLRTDLYRCPALVPINRNINKTKPAATPHHLTYHAAEGDKPATLSWSKVHNARYYVVYAFDSNDQFYNCDNSASIVCITADTHVDLSQYVLPENTVFMVTSINYYHVESQPTKPVFTSDPVKQWLKHYK